MKIEFLIKYDCLRPQQAQVQPQNQIATQNVTHTTRQQPVYSNLALGSQPPASESPSSSRPRPAYEEVHKVIHYHHVHHRPKQPTLPKRPPPPPQQSEVAPTHVIIEPGNMPSDGTIHQITIEKVPIEQPKHLPSYHSDTRLYQPKYRPRHRRRREYICLPHMDYYLDDFNRYCRY